MKRILVIEDEPQMLLGLRDNLELEGYEVQTAADGDEGLAKARRSSPDLVILDVMLPRKNGFDVCRELRAAREPDADRDADGALGRDRQGARPRARRRRLRHQAVLDHRAAGARPRRAAPRAAQKPPASDAVRIGDIEIDFKLHQARRGRARIEFTAREFDLLRYFVQHTGQVVTREQILNQVWGYEEFADHPDHRQLRRQAAAEDRARPARARAHPDDSRLRLQVRRVEARRRLNGTP